MLTAASPPLLSLHMSTWEAALASVAGCASLRSLTNLRLGILHGWQDGSGVSKLLTAVRTTLTRLSLCVLRDPEPPLTGWDLPVLKMLHTNVKVGVLSAPQLESVTAEDDVARSFLRFAATADEESKSVRFPKLSSFRDLGMDPLPLGDLVRLRCLTGPPESRRPNAALSVATHAATEKPQAEFSG
jgi:hypothetical protein